MDPSPGTIALLTLVLFALKTGFEMGSKEKK